MTTIANTTPAVISLADFVKDFGTALRDAVDLQNPPVFHREDTCPIRDAVMDGLIRAPFVAQREAVHAITALLVDQGEKAGDHQCRNGDGQNHDGDLCRCGDASRGLPTYFGHFTASLSLQMAARIKETVPNARVCAQWCGYVGSLVATADDGENRVQP